MSRLKDKLVGYAIVVGVPLVLALISTLITLGLFVALVTLGLIPEPTP